MATENLIPIADLFEAHLTVSELDRAVAFYRDRLSLPLARVFPDRKVAFFWIGAPGKAMLGLWEAGTMPMSISLHVAFQVALSDLQEAPSRLQKADALIAQLQSQQQVLTASIQAVNFTIFGRNNVNGTA